MKNFGTFLCSLMTVSTILGSQTFASQTGVVETLKSEGDVEVCALSHLNIDGQGTVLLRRSVYMGQEVDSTVDTKLPGLFSFAYSNMKSDNLGSQLSLAVIGDQVEKRITIEERNKKTAETIFVRKVRIENVDEAAIRENGQSFHLLNQYAGNNLINYFKDRVGSVILLNCHSKTKLK